MSVQWHISVSEAECIRCSHLSGPGHVHQALSLVSSLIFAKHQKRALSSTQLSSLRNLSRSALSSLNFESSKSLFVAFLRMGSFTWATCKSVIESLWMMIRADNIEAAIYILCTSLTKAKQETCTLPQVWGLYFSRQCYHDTHPLAI